MDDFIGPTYEHILHINQTMIARYGGVAHHVLNGGPLHNALNLIAGPIYGQDMFPTLPEKAAKVAHSIATGHVFSDANKRTAASSLDLVLNLNGHSLLVPENDLVEMMYRLAAPGGVPFEEFLAWTTPRVVAGP